MRRMNISQILLLICALLNIFTKATEIVETDCSICHNEMTDHNSQIINCGHKYCIPCLQDLQQNGFNCPNCGETLHARSPLISKIKANQIEGVKFILKRVPQSINIRNELNEIPLTVAIQNECEQMVKILIENGADVNSQNENDETPLMIAWEKKNESILFLLLKNDSVNISTEIENQIFYHALDNGFELIIKLLIEKGENIRQMKNDLTPLMKAVLENKIGIAKILIEADKSTIEQTNSKNWTPLFIAANAGMVKFLIEQGANVKHRDNYKRNVLFYVLNDIEIVKLLVTHDSSLVEEKDIFKYNPLMKAVVENNTLISSILITAIAKEDITIAKNDQGDTALAIAAYYGHIKCIELLMKINPDAILQTNEKGLCALDVAVENKKYKVVSCFIDKWFEFLTPEMIQKARARANDKKTKNSFITTIDEAVKENCIDKLKILLERKPQLIDEKNSDHQTPVMIACEYGFVEIAKLLIEKSNSLHSWDSIGDTALLMAVRKGHMEIVKMVVEKQNMRIFDCNKKAENTIIMAHKHGHRKIARYLRRECPSVWRLGAKAIIVWMIAVPVALHRYAYIKCNPIYDKLKLNSIIFGLCVLIYWFPQLFGIKKTE